MSYVRCEGIPIGRIRAMADIPDGWMISIVMAVVNDNNDPAIDYIAYPFFEVRDGTGSPRVILPINENADSVESIARWITDGAAKEAARDAARNAPR